ncbi:hypothetical protein JDW21_19030 [Bacillus subtilis]|uniref:Uncharacterized protein n=1 Tax=Bacillus phage vB_BsuS_PJN02 TaxID=2920374 RepID=A0AC61TS50_9CAUD|nr:MULTISPECIES: hypothetical protein [Bacillus subtilis group]YP_010681797.1 hypothetical protein PQE76_gp179 [Bacillus phage vB_BsuS_PJN02]MCR4362101.1 hypothetical protein [Bacillus subtilis]UNH58522.1 hypothetical protein [Bacillus phage vB_BsuS_PJN02]UQB84289.1 hypothetical protein KMZ31_19395 [Bacillus amyloliquefaciens]WOF32920.1 hypothetical protein OEJ84_23770 [Bacillus subtilis]
MEANRLDAVFKIIDSIDNLRSIECIKMLKEFGEMEKVYPIVLGRGERALQGYITEEKADELNYGFDDLEDETERMIDNGVISGGGLIFNVMGVVMKIL